MHTMNAGPVAAVVVTIGGDDVETVSGWGYGEETEEESERRVGG